MQMLASYFDPSPEVNHAVEFMVFMRFTVGGSALHTASAIAISLGDGGVYKCHAWLTPMRARVLQPGVLFDLGTDKYVK